VRRLLLERLVGDERGTARQAPFNPALTANALQQELGRAQQRAGEIAGSLPVLLRLPGEVWSRMMHDRTAGGFGLFLPVFALSIAAAIATDRGLARRLYRYLPPPPPLEYPPVGSRASAALMALLIETARLAGFAVAAVLVFFVLGSDDPRDRTTFVFYLSAAAIVKASAALARAYLAPTIPGARIPAFEDHEAVVLYGAILRTTAFGAFGFFTCALIATLGLTGDSHTLLLILVGTLTTLLLTQCLWASRHAIASDIAGERHDPGRPRLNFARLWPNVMVVLLPLLWLGLVLAALTAHTPLFGAALYSVALLLLLPSADAALWRQTKALAFTGKPALAAASRVARLGLIVLAFLNLASAWQIDLRGFASDSIGAGAANASLQILVTLFVAYGLWQVVSIWVDRLTADEDRQRAEQLGIEDTEIDEQGRSGHSRLRTLLPILKRAVQIALGRSGWPSASAARHWCATWFPAFSS
jgi:hypothetical protein